MTIFVTVQNTLAILPVMAMTALSGEAYTLMSLNWKPEAVLALVASCIGGVGMSYFSFALRAVISATSFSVIGNICKVLTILVNLLIWENHSSKCCWTWLYNCIEEVQTLVSTVADCIIFQMLC